jgi:hypothetical protein
MFIAAIRPAMFLQAKSLLCGMKKCSKSFSRKQNAVTFTVSFRGKYSALFFESSRSPMRSERSLCVILCGSVEVTFRKNSRSLEVDGYGFSSGVFFFSSSESREKLLGVLE